MHGTLAAMLYMCIICYYIPGIITRAQISLDLIIIRPWRHVTLLLLHHPFFLPISGSAKVVCKIK
jgi:hypothetical protein